MLSRNRVRLLAWASISSLLITSLAGMTGLVYASLTFSTILNLSNNPGTSSFPQLAASGSYVYVVWQDNTPGRPNTFFRAGSHNGTGFGPVVNLSNDTAYSLNPQVAASGSNVYVVWQDNATSNYKTYFRASSNYGSGFAPTINLGTTARVDETNPQVATSNNNVYVVWLESAKTPAVYFRASNNYGNSFGSPIILTGSAGTSFPPVITVQGSNIYLAWRQNVAAGNDDIFFDASSNNGTSFGSVVNLSNNPGESFNPEIAATGSNVYVVWPDSNPGHFQTFFRGSTNNGVTWSPSISQSALNLSSDPGIAIEPQVAASGNGVYVSWRDSTLGNSQIFFKASNTNGASFGPLLNLSSDTGTAYNAHVAATGSNVYAVWSDTTPGVEDIFLVTSTNGGGSFGSPTNLSNNPGFSLDPQLAATSSNVYVAWDDDTPGNKDIFFKIGALATIAQPSAYSQTLRTNQNQSVAALLTGGDPAGLALTFYIVSTPIHGILGSVTSAGPSSAQVNYTPNAGFLGTDSFTFKVGNGWMNSTTATVSITVQTLGTGVGGGTGGGRAPLAF